MKPAASDITDFALESMFTRARKTMELGPALRHVLAELDAIRCSRIPAVVLAVVDEVAARHGTSREVLLGRGRHQTEARNRVICWWLLHSRFEMSYPEIGEVFSGRNHDGMSLQVRALNDILRVNDVLAAEVASIEAAVRVQMAKRAA